MDAEPHGTPASHGPPLRSLLLALLFVLSGATALTYEVLWFKRFAHVWGSAPIAMAAVVASFLLGLGIGAQRIGILADRLPRPFRAYGWCELGIGLLALAVPLELGLLTALEAWFYPWVAEHPLLGAFLRCALTFLVLGPPCILMGGTLPLLVKAYASLGAGVGRSTGALYAFNTLGAALGAYLAGFHLLPAWGIGTTNLVAVGTNLAIGVAALGLARTFPVVAPAPAGDAPQATRRAGIGLVPAMAWTLGCAALVLQIVWMRQMALVVGGSTYAFSAVLVVILLGLGLGSLIYRMAFDGVEDRDRLGGLVRGLLTVLVLASLLGQLALGPVSDLVGTVVELRASALHNAAVCMAAAVALAFVPALAFGCLFPVLVRAHFRAAGSEGRTVGAISWWNTFGCLVGATLTPLVLVPTLGTDVAAAAALILCAGVVGASARLGSVVRPAAFGLAAGLGLVVVLAATRDRDPLRLNLGAYSYGYTPAEERVQELLFFREGRACNVAVTDNPNRALRLNGKVDAGDAADMPTQLSCAYLPRFLRPWARDTLVLGFGSGVTCGAALLFPDSSVVCCEIEEEVFHAGRYFEHVNHDPAASERFSIRFLDGRSHLQGTRERYDVIISVPSNPWMAGIGNLFTRSFYRAAQDRLRTDGLFVQWVQTYEMPAEDYAMVLRTIGSVFKNCGILRIDDLDTLVVASDGDLLPSTAGLEKAQAMVDASPAVGQDLGRYFGTRSVSRLLARHFLVSPRGLRGLLERQGGRELHTDDNLRLEFDSARRLFHYTPETDALVLEGFDPAWQRILHGRVPDPEALLAEWTGLHRRLEEAGVTGAGELVEAGYQLAPDNPYFLLHDTLQRDELEGEELRARVNQLAEISSSLTNRLGGYFWQDGDHARAELVYRTHARALAGLGHPVGQPGHLPPAPGGPDRRGRSPRARPGDRSPERVRPRTRALDGRPLGRGCLRLRGTRLRGRLPATYGLDPRVLAVQDIERGPGGQPRELDDHLDGMGLGRAGDLLRVPARHRGFRRSCDGRRHLLPDASLADAGRCPGWRLSRSTACRQAVQGAPARTQGRRDRGRGGVAPQRQRVLPAPEVLALRGGSA